MQADSKILSISENLKKLPNDKISMIEKLVDFLVSESSKPATSSTSRLLKHFDSISDKDADEMRAAIEKECERVDLNEW